MSKGVQIALGASVIAVLLGWYASRSLEGEGAYRYFQTLGELRAAGEVPGHVRVHGFVAQGSISRDVAGRQIHFAVQSRPPHEAGTEASPLSVAYGSLEVSDMFKDGAEVVVEGRLDTSGPVPVFRATNVLAKCPSKFQAQPPAAS
ncbi:MAG: cytochrome c maturation protein CcmE [Deltaproteobacteria bacterium]|nr:cytochrome c maturation protein CcmE [Deltaproteobacteria bacterium]